MTTRSASAKESGHEAKGNESTAKRRESSQKSSDEESDNPQKLGASERNSLIPTDDSDEIIINDLHRLICTIDELPKDWIRKPYINTGYRLNMGGMGSIWSICDRSHNDFYEIWSDLVPLIVFLGITSVQISSDRFWNQCSYAMLLESGVYAGVILCRGLSFVYHVFNCCDIWSNHRMIYVDQLGITSMSLVSPYFYALAQNRVDLCASVSAESFQIYTLMLMSVAFVSYITFISALILQNADWVVLVREPMLVTLAAIGNWAAINLLIDESQPPLLRALSGGGCLVLCFGYAVFYTLRVPDRFTVSGDIGLKPWASHVLWHCCVGASQLLYIIVPYFYHDK